MPGKPQDLTCSPEHEQAVTLWTESWSSCQHPPWSWCVRPPQSPSQSLRPSVEASVEASRRPDRGGPPAAGRCAHPGTAEPDAGIHIALHPLPCRPALGPRGSPLILPTFPRVGVLSAWWHPSTHNWASARGSGFCWRGTQLRGLSAASSHLQTPINKSVPSKLQLL